MKFHWLENVFLVARVQKGAFFLSLMYFQSPKTFIRANFFRTNDQSCEILRKNFARMIIRAKFCEKNSHKCKK